MSSLAAWSAAIVSLYSEFSALRTSVDSATDLSRALMLAVKDLISSPSWASPPVASSLAFSKLSYSRSNTLCSSSDLSIAVWQYSFFESSSCCSLPSKAVMSSIILRTFSKLPDRPANAIMIMFKRVSSFLPCLAFKASIALRFKIRPLTWVCSSAGLGKVFLNNSRASSSLRILIVSARATSSSPLVLDLSSHSAFFVVHEVDMSARNFRSSSKAAVLSSRSSLS
mmetsp:Transcript_88331/g.253032  ORF Transcript_88331/g.253032 Transcript_88331/m.253032 type:complete len:226 (+) Transcript_88331:782-1459(+)